MHAFLSPQRKVQVIKFFRLDFLYVGNLIPPIAVFTYVSMLFHSCHPANQQNNPSSYCSFLLSDQLQLLGSARKLDLFQMICFCQIVINLNNTLPHLRPKIHSQTTCWSSLKQIDFTHCIKKVQHMEKGENQNLRIIFMREKNIF